ncbi:hypothetical protein [Halogeometricum luteum]|uniref:Uncharacterized protein n=1 Tax=Halogeometricum luteum TaxID=2950537 RepID=A0ABU2G798_9EURY|nr:hypothetical protein [Halogeometricum sp. S3BR5-2]MDS0296660.1 hypothetical protein [Halogeometricum sp. S3BR5-2]
MDDSHVVATGSPDGLIEQYGGQPRLVVRTEADAESLLEIGYQIAERANELFVYGIGAAEIADAVKAFKQLVISSDGDIAVRFTVEGIPIDVSPAV